MALPPSLAVCLSVRTVDVQSLAFNLFYFYRPSLWRCGSATRAVQRFFLAFFPAFSRRCVASASLGVPSISGLFPVPRPRPPPYVGPLSNYAPNRFEESCSLPYLVPASSSSFMCSLALSEIVLRSRSLFRRRWLHITLYAFPEESPPLPCTYTAAGINARRR